MHISAASAADPISARVWAMTRARGPVYGIGKQFGDTSMATEGWPVRGKPALLIDGSHCTQLETGDMQMRTCSLLM